MKRFWLSICVAMPVMTVWLAAQLHIYDITWSQESDFCIWVSLAQQLLDFGLSPGELVTNYNRSIGDLLLALPEVVLFGLNTKVAFLSFALPYAVAFTLAGSLVAWRREGGKWRFDVFAFVLFNLLVGSLFQHNTGHPLTFTFAVMVYYVFSMEDRIGEKVKWIVLMGASFLGYLNDDFFVLMAILPVVGLNALQWLSGRRLNPLSIPVLLGAGMGLGMLKLLYALQLVAYPRLETSLYPFDKMCAMLVETVKAYASNFALLDLLGIPLTASVALRLAAYGTVAGLSVLAVVYVARRVISSRSSPSHDLDVIILLAICAVTGAYALVASSTKPIDVMVPRYVYYGMVLMLFLLARWWRMILPAKRMRVLAVALVVLAAGFLFKANIVGNWANIRAHHRFDEVAEMIRKEGLHVAYCEWWTAKAIEAASNGALRVYPLAPVPTQVEPAGCFYLRRVFGERCHAVVIPNYRAHYPADVAEATIRSRIGSPDKELSTEWFKIFIYKKNIALSSKAD